MEYPVVAPRRAYSYTRFSTPEQANGDSLRRQTQSAKAWAESRGLVLDETLRLVDLGVSAFKGANTDQSLGRFIEAIDAGVVPAGSVLIVESLDRLSRLPHRRAMRLLEDIVDRGVSVTTLSDGQEYTRERLDGDPTALVVALLVAFRAHEESRIKGQRVGAAWQEKRRQVRAGEAERLTRRAPAWLVPEGTSWAVDEEKAAIVRRIYQATLSGVGEHTIAAELNREGVAPLGRGGMWHRSAVSKLLRNRAVIGELVPGHIEHYPRRHRVLEEPIPGAFPAIISRADWDAVRLLKETRAAQTSTSKASPRIANILAGLARCPICGSAMLRVAKGSRKKGGKPKLVCSRAKAGGGCPYHSVAVDAVEQCIVNHWGEIVEQMPAGDCFAGLDAQAKAAESELRGAEEKLWQLADALSVAPSHAGAMRLAQQEREVASARAKLEEQVHAQRLFDGGIVEARLGRFIDAAQTATRDIAEAREPLNAALRILFACVVVDYISGRLVFQWKQGGTAVLSYDFPGLRAVQPSAQFDRLAA